jgi:hypothetical protein
MLVLVTECSGVVGADAGAHPDALACKTSERA